MSVLSLIFFAAGLPCRLLAADALEPQPEISVAPDPDLLRLPPSAAATDAGLTLPTYPADMAREKYHWRGLLLQSLAFNAVENTFRLATDDQIRDILANKAYWHNYTASLKQFNMHRWNDGDNFLVNYVGHPIQGAVASYIEIQNDPTGRLLEIGKSREYWKSRTMALLWSTIYSTQSEIGPLGEAGIGNEGGWTYPILDCVKPCPAYRPGVTHYTNNTGWVDFIITPSVGFLWVLAEDTLDRFVSDPYQRSDTAYRLGYPKILRASLSPARSFANVLRGQKPWYRDWQNMGTPYFSGFHISPSDEQIEEQARRPRFEISPHFASLSIAVNTPACHNCRETVTGTGIEGSYRLTHWLDADVDVNRMPKASPLPSDRAGGNLTSGYFGVRTGFDTEHYALKLAIRPGFVQFDDAYLTSPVPDAPEAPETGTITHFAWNFAVSGDYRIGRNFALRASLGETLVRYRTDELDPPGIGTPPYLSWLTHENFVNRGNWTIEAGPVFRFGGRNDD